LISFCFCYPGWFPNTQGWYPEVQTLHGSLLNNVLIEWKPTQHRFCEELKPVWNMLREGLFEHTFSIQFFLKRILLFSYFVFIFSDRSPSTIVISAQKDKISLQIDVKYIDDSYIIDETFQSTQKDEVLTSLLFEQNPNLT
jgi:hypothetical protein